MKKKNTKSKNKNNKKTQARKKRDQRPNPLSDLNIPRFQSERLSRMMDKLIAQKEISSPEELEDFLSRQIVGTPLDEIRDKVELDPVEEAQELAFQAMEARTRETAEKLARQALELDPGCIDARMVLVPDADDSAEETIGQVRQIVRDAEQAMGEDYINETREHFWSAVETRPYMRARQSLVELLRGFDRIDEAIAECEGMLELNPNDNQGMRDTLLGLYLQRGKKAKARKLIKSFEDDASAVFCYGRVLERFLAGDRSSALTELILAANENPFVLDLMMGIEPMPEEEAAGYVMGDISEAAYCLEQIGHAWLQYPAALEWLFDQIQHLPDALESVIDDYLS